MNDQTNDYKNQRGGVGASYELGTNFTLQGLNEPSETQIADISSRDNKRKGKDLKKKKDHDEFEGDSNEDDEVPEDNFDSNLDLIKGKID